MSTATATPNLAGAQTLNFGGVLPGSSGPDITVNPNFGPPGINFAGGIQINAPTVWYVRSRSDFGDGFVEVEA
jgi:hypothetical protein